MKPNAKQLPIDHLDDIVGSIVSTVPTDAIYVFGSYARGEQTPDSDIDLYVVTKDAAKRPLAYGALVRKALLWMKRPKDVLCSSSDAFAQRSHDLSTPEYIVAREGVKIYNP